MSNLLRRAVVAAALVPTLLVQPVVAAGGRLNGWQACPSYKYVVVWSRASIHVEHRWGSNGYISWINQTPIYRESATALRTVNYQITWSWTKEAAGAACTT